MKFNETIGIDVSKPFVDVFIFTRKKHKRFKNNNKGFKEMILWVDKHIHAEQCKALYAFEHTGLYSLALSVFLTKNETPYILIPGLELKRSLGISRGKTDRVDARFIALYAYRRRDEIKPYKLPSKNLLDLRRLLALRDKLIKQRSGYKATKTEIKQILTKKDHIVYFKVHSDMIKALTKQIKLVEKQLMSLVNEDEELQKMFNLITGIKGVGMLTALFMIAYTNGFTLFENHRKFASYAGIAPFPYQSGISIKGKSKVHPFANKKFKSLLTNCAVNAIVTNAEMKQYYLRRIEEGKSKMSTINIIRNKLLARIFAVVNRGTPYVNICAYAK
jgi:transposase